MQGDLVSARHTLPSHWQTPCTETSRRHGDVPRPVQAEPADEPGDGRQRKVSGLLEECWYIYIYVDIVDKNIDTGIDINTDVDVNVDIEIAIEIDTGINAETNSTDTNMNM